MADSHPELHSIRDYIRWAASEFSRHELFFGHGTDNALDEAFHLVCWVVGLGYDLPPVYLEAALTAPEKQRIEALVAKRIKERKPVAYLTGEAWFCGMEFEVDERVLVPRSPLAELVAEHFSPWLSEEPSRVLDLCCGSGCIGIAAAVCPQAQVDLVDIDDGPIELSKANVARHHLQDQVRVVQSDLFAALEGERYDLILSNPPYVPTAEYEGLAPEFHAEPKLGLEAGADGMAIVARILDEAPDHLTEDGILICEVGAAVPEFLQRFGELNVIWPEFEQGGEGVFIVSAEDLRAWRAQAQGR